MSTTASCAQVCTVASRPTLPQQHRTRGAQGAGYQVHHVGGGVQSVPTGVRIGAEWLSCCPARRAETLPHLGFNFNRGTNFVPCVVTNSEGRGIPARYTRVIMGPKPHVIGIILGDCNQYVGPLHALPDHDMGERPRYAHDDPWQFKYGADERARFDNALEHLHDLLLTTEVAQFGKVSRLFFTYQEEVCKIDECMWEAGQLKDTSVRRLEGANVLNRIKAAAEELDRRVVPQQEHMHTERGCST